MGEHCLNLIDLWKQGEKESYFLPALTSMSGCSDDGADVIVCGVRLLWRHCGVVYISIYRFLETFL